MAESTVGWFGVRGKYCSLADKPWLISQIRPNEQAAYRTGCNQSNVVDTTTVTAR